MRRLLLSLLTALVAMVMVASPAGAITYGEPDAGEHPYVGFMIFFDPNEPGWFSCSGTLLDANTFLTAGHCTYGVGTEGEVVLGPDGEPLTSGGTDVWVTFDETEVPAGWPARADYPTEEALYDARSAWLDANPDYISGTAYPHPDDDNFSAFPVNFDVGVVELDEAAPVTTFGELAPLGTAEARAGDTGQGRNSALVENVGYGIQSVQPKPMDVETRYKSTSRIVEVNGNIAQGGNLHTLNNPSAVGGRGGTCFGDSGLPGIDPVSPSVRRGRPCCARSRLSGSGRHRVAADTAPPAPAAVARNDRRLQRALDSAAPPPGQAVAATAWILNR